MSGARFKFGDRVRLGVQGIRYATVYKGSGSRDENRGRDMNARRRRGIVFAVRAADPAHGEPFSYTVSWDDGSWTAHAGFLLESAAHEEGK